MVTLQLSMGTLIISFINYIFIRESMNKTLRDEIALAVLPTVIATGIAIYNAGNYRQLTSKEEVEMAFHYADEFIKQSEAKSE